MARPAALPEDRGRAAVCLLDFDGKERSVDSPHCKNIFPSTPLPHDTFFGGSTEDGTQTTRILGKLWALPQLL